MAAKKRTKKKETEVISNKELRDILLEEMSPAAKILKIGIIMSGGVDLDPYVIGYKCAMHAAEVHRAFSELKHHKAIEPGLSKNTINLKRG